MGPQIPKGNLSIKVVIGNKHYPMKIDSQEEEVVRQAAKAVNEKIKLFQQSFAADKQDVLSMVALNFAIEALKKSNPYPPEQGETDLVHKASAIAKQLDEFLAADSLS